MRKVRTAREPSNGLRQLSEMRNETDSPELALLLELMIRSQYAFENRLFTVPMRWEQTLREIASIARDEADRVSPPTSDTHVISLAGWRASRKGT